MSAACFNINCDQNYNTLGQTYCASCGSPLTLKDRYAATQLLGCGGFGRTFAGIDQGTGLGKSCAIKQLHIPYMVGASKQKVLELFERESQWLYQLDDHPQTPKFIDYFAEGENLYLIQELITGQTLTQEIEARNSLYQEIEVVEFLSEVISILKYIHHYKIIHRDLKPDNFIRRDSDQKWVLIDFGASRILSETALIGGATVIGTPEYMAPEQHRGQALPATDLYSLGLICVQLITGHSTLKMFNLETSQWFWTNFIPKNTVLTKSFVLLLNDLIAPTLGDRLKSTTQVEQYLKRMERRRTQGRLQTHQRFVTSPRPRTTFVNSGDQPTVLAGGRPPVQHAVWEPPVVSHRPQQQFDLKKLAFHLRLHRWKAADRETWHLVNKSVGKKSNAFLFPQDVERIPCELLRDIDQLWRQHSNNYFGFKPQLKIYASVSGKYHLFCTTLGWPLISRNSDPEKDFKFKTHAPCGHLPSRQKMGGTNLKRNLQVLYKKLSESEFFQDDPQNL